MGQTMLSIFDFLDLQSPLQPLDQGSRKFNMFNIAKRGFPLHLQYVPSFQDLRAWEMLKDVMRKSLKPGKGKSLYGLTTVRVTFWTNF